MSKDYTSILITRGKLREKGGGGRLLNKALFGEASPRGPVPLNILFLTKDTPFVYLPLKSCTLLIYLLRENKAVRKEVFRSFSSNLNM